MIVGAVDAHAIHAAGDKVADQAVVGCGLARHGDHDPDVAVDWFGPEQGRRILLEVGFAQGGIDGSEIFKVPTCQFASDIHYRIEVS